MADPFPDKFFSILAQAHHPDKSFLRAKRKENKETTIFLRKSSFISAQHFAEQSSASFHSSLFTFLRKSRAGDLEKREDRKEKNEKNKKKKPLTRLFFLCVNYKKDIIAVLC